jgi:integrase/recombinase XerD
LEDQPNNPHFRFWLKDKRQKSQVGFIIPILPQALAIIQKHNRLQNIPLITNQKYNKYLKEIAEVLNIQKYLTTHVGRKTFGFYALNLGASYEVVARILGHKTIATTQKLYAKVLDPRIGEEMRKVSDKTKSPIITHISEEDKKLFLNNKI